jgi:hypothetical protein
MNSEFSESTYAYALTSELIEWRGTQIQSAPVFPSTWEEGQPGMGYDVVLDRPGIPLFIQFKLSQCLVQRNAKEVRLGLLSVPYYRMHLRPASLSKQHAMLLDLERAGNEVKYAAPMFYETDEFNSHYFRHTMLPHSLWLSPLAIGPLPDGNPHYVACSQGGAHYLCSEPTLLKAGSQYELFVSEVSDRMRPGRLQDPQRAGVSLKAIMTDVVLSNLRDNETAQQLARAWIRAEEGKDAQPLVFCGALASHFMQASLFWVTPKPELGYALAV